MDTNKKPGLLRRLAASIGALLISDEGSSPKLPGTNVGHPNLGVSNYQPHIRPAEIHPDFIRMVKDRLRNAENER